MLFCRAGIREGGKRVKLARYVHEGESAIVTPSEGLTSTEIKISILVWEGPVSYTHLDVYKRQASGIRRSGFADPLHSEMSSIGAISPVSYTHLDVYKRQG